MKLITVNNFAVKYNVNHDQINNYRFKNKKPFIKRGIYYYIDEEFFIKRKEFEVKVWNEAYELFHFLNKRMSAQEIAKMMSLLELGHICPKRINLWSTYLSRSLFVPLDESILIHKVGKVLWRFWRNAKWAVRMMFKRCGVKKENRDLERIFKNAN